MPPLSKIQVFDPSQTMGNYLKTRGAKRTEERQNVLAGQRDISFENALADRERRLTTEAEDRTYEQRMKGIKEDEIWRKQGMDIAMQVDPDADDAVFQEQVSKIPDALGARMSDLGYTSEDIQKTTQNFFRSGIWSKKGIIALQEKAGLRQPAAKLTGAAANLEIILGRKPTTKELQDFTAKKGGAGQMPADAKMVDYMVRNKIAKNKKQAYKMVQMSKSDPVKLVSDMVSKAEKAQSDAYIEPGDPGYKDRQTMISDAQQMVQGIRRQFIGEEEPGYTPQHVVGGADFPAALPGGGQAPTPASNEPVPQTQADFDALTPGTTYRDPDDGKLYTK